MQNFPSRTHTNRIAIYLPYRSGVLDNIKQQNLIFSEPNTKEVTIRSPFSKDRSDFKFEQDVRTMIEAIEKTNVLVIVNTNRGLFDPFSNGACNGKTMSRSTEFQIHWNVGILVEDILLHLRIPSTYTQAPNGKNVHRPRSKQDALLVFASQNIFVSQP